MTETLQRAFSRYFTDAATPVDLHDDRLIPLTNPGRVLLVEHGSVDVFGVRLENGRPVGRWTFLTRCEAGAMLLGSPGGPRHSLAVRPIPRSYISTLPLPHLAALSPGGRASAQLSAGAYGVAVQQMLCGLERGLEDLAHALREELPPRQFVPLAPAGPTELDPGATARSVDGVRWVRVDDGAVHMPDGAAGRLTRGYRVFLTERDWLVAQDGAVLTANSTMDLLYEGELWPTLTAHVGRFLYAVDRRIERRRRAEQDQLRERAAADAEAATDTARALDAVLQDSGARVRLGDVAASPPAVAAIRLIAAVERAPVRLPAGFVVDPADRRDPVQQVADAAGMRTRTVKLEDRWWKADLGPFVARRSEDGRPLAVLPDRRGYVLALPEENRVVAVDREVAATLRGTGTVVYPPLPASATTLRGLLAFGRRGSGRDLAKLLLTGVLVAAFGMLTPVIAGQVLGSFVAAAQRDLITEGALLLIGVAVVTAVVSMVQNIAALRLEGRWGARMQAAVWMRLLTLPASFFERYSTGQLGTTVLGVLGVQEALSSVTTTAAFGLLTGLANLVVIFYYDVRLALIALALVAVSAAVAAVAGIRQVRWQRQLYAIDQRLSSRVFQLLTAVPKLRVAAAEDRALRVWAEDFRRRRTIAVSARRGQNALTSFNAGFPPACAAVLFALVAGVFRGELGIASFVAFFLAFNLLLASTLQFTSVMITVMSVVPMLERIEPILAADPEEHQDKPLPGELSGRIALSHLSFRFGHDGPLVLDDLSLTVEPGEFVAIVGPTGCGKSTLVRLLLGFEAPLTGSVLYDGKDLAELDVTTVRRQCGVVLQHGALLAGSVLDNIVGTTLFTEDDAWAAARMSGIAEEIEAMPMKMQTVLAEGGSALSGGQRQRIMIARALVSRPRIVIFDEATSALDNPTQEVVSESTRRLNATRIVIAHRLSTVTHADRIIVMDHGRIVQQGTYAQLIEGDTGMFARLANGQVS